MYAQLALTLSCFIAASSTYQPYLMDWQVETSTGFVQGLIDNSTGVPVQAFLGIPYAEAPVRSLRFRRPVPVYRWTDTLLAIRRGPACVQPPSSYPWAEGVNVQSENCLHLNVWAPITAKEGKKKAVMFYIFGGDFSVGSNNAGEGHIYDGDVLAQRDVIVVTVNYRVGVLGFGTSGTDDAPGNNGLHDILVALKWVHRNIPAFGGDPKRLTIFGQGSGSVATSLLALSPMAQGLFSNVILMSGTAAASPHNQTERNIRLTQKYADAVGCYTENFTLYTDPEGVFDCLRETDPHKLSSAVFVDSFNPIAPAGFYPQYGDELLPEDALIALQSGDFRPDFNLLIGDDFSEGALQLATAYPDLFDPFAGANPTVDKETGEELLKGIFRDFPDPDSVVNYYLGPIGEQNYSQILREMSFAVGDYKVLCPAVYFAESFSNKSSAYFYLHSYRTQRRPTYSSWIGVPIFSEVPLVFGQPWKPDFINGYTNKDRNMSTAIMEIWTHFAKHGSPPNGFAWPSYNAASHDYIFPYYNVRYLLTDGPHMQNCDFFRDFFQCDLQKSAPEEYVQRLGSSVDCTGLPQSSLSAVQAAQNRTQIGTPIYFADAYVIDYPYN